MKSPESGFQKEVISKVTVKFPPGTLPIHEEEITDLNGYYTHTQAYGFLPDGQNVPIEEYIGNKLSETNTSEVILDINATVDLLKKLKDISGVEIMDNKAKKDNQPKKEGALSHAESADKL